jgi:hypothetical protein
MTFTKHANNNRVNHKKALSGATQTLTTDIYDTITPNGGGALYDVPKGQLDKFTA